VSKQELQQKKTTGSPENFEKARTPLLAAVANAFENREGEAETGSFNPIPDEA